jgi:PPP family 3-phenylpropionic acid transporter
MVFFGFGSYASSLYHTILFEYHKGMNEAQIGNILMVAAIIQIMTPFLIIWSGRFVSNPNQILTWLFFGIAVNLIILPLIEGFYPILFFYTLLSFFIGGSFPLAITSILAASKSLSESWFLFARSMGTLGFALFCLFSAILAADIPLEQVYPFFALSALTAFILSKYNNHLPRQITRPSVRHTIKLLSQHQTPRLLFIIALASIAAYGGTTLLGNFIRSELGGTNADVGKAWSIATFFEIPLIWAGIYLFRRMGLKNLMLAGIVILGIRFSLNAFCPSIEFFFYIQTIHGLFYGATLTGMGIYFRRVYGEQHVHHLQLFAGVIYGGLASALSGKIGTLIWEYQGLRTMYIWFGAFAFMAALALWRFAKIPDSAYQKASEL